MKKLLPVTLFLILSVVLLLFPVTRGRPSCRPLCRVTVAVTGTLLMPQSDRQTEALLRLQPGAVVLPTALNGGAPQASGTFANLAAGIYTVSARSSSGCTGSQQLTVTAVDPCLNNSITVTATTATVTPCITPGTGSITVTAGGSTGFTYSIDGTTFQASNVFNAVAANAYTVTVKDAIGCIRQPPLQ
jgi:hypothetical protein